MTDAMGAELQAAVNALEAEAERRGVVLIAVVGKLDEAGNLQCGGTGPESDDLCGQMFMTYAAMRAGYETKREMDDTERNRGHVQLPRAEP